MAVGDLGAVLGPSVVTKQSAGTQGCWQQVAGMAVKQCVLNWEHSGEKPNTNPSHVLQESPPASRARGLAFIYSSVYDPHAHVPGPPCHSMHRPFHCLGPPADGQGLGKPRLPLSQ